MSLSVGIVGLPNVGKSTLFNALTKNSVPAENYPFCTIDPSVGIVPVPDKRLTELAEMSKSKETIPAVVEFVDIAGLVKGASQGEGLGNQFLTNIRETDAIVHVVRLFEDADILHTYGDVGPVRDMEIIDTELILADLETIEKRKEKISREVKRGEKDAVAENEAIIEAEQLLKENKFLNAGEFKKEHKAYLDRIHLLTFKKVLYAFNTQSGGHNINEKMGAEWERAEEYVKSQGAESVIIDAGVEYELSSVAEEDIDEFRREFGVHESGVQSMIRKSYEILNLITFLTTGEKESRAWTVVSGSSAPVAAGKIHTDFQDKFIRAEVISATDLLASGSYANAREKGLVRTEGKEYIVKDGDVMIFLHS